MKRSQLALYIKHAMGQGLCIVFDAKLFSDSTYNRILKFAQYMPPYQREKDILLKDGLPQYIHACQSVYIGHYDVALYTLNVLGYNKLPVFGKPDPEALADINMISHIFSPQASHEAPVK